MKQTIIFFLLLCSSLGYSQDTCFIELVCKDGKIEVKEASYQCTPGRPIKIKVTSDGCCQQMEILRGKEPGKMVENFSFYMPKEATPITVKCNGTQELTFMLNVDTGAPESNGINTLQDAIQLAGLWKEYQSTGKGLADMQAIIKANGLNRQTVYLKDYPDTLFKRASTVTDSIQRPLSTSSKTAEASSSSSVPAAGLSGLFSPTLIIDGLAKFAAKRFRQELTIAYLQKFRDTLISPQYEELGVMLPRTYHTILNGDVFNYTSFFQSLHENAQTDLYNLPENSANLVRLKEAEIDPEAYPVILASLDLPRLLELRIPASNAIEMLAFRDYIYLEKGKQTVYGNTARLLGIFSTHIHSWDKATATGWVDANHLQKMIADKDVFNFWMAILLKKDSLTLQQITLHIDGADTSLYSLLTTKLPQAKQFTTELLARFNEVEIAGKQLLELSQKDSITAKDRFFKYTTATLGLVEAQIKLVQQLAKDDLATQERCKKLIHIVKAGKDLSVFAHNKRFGDALSVALEIFRLIYDETQRRSIQVDSAKMAAYLKAKTTLEQAQELRQIVEIKATKSLLKAAESHYKTTGKALKDDEKEKVKSYIKKIKNGSVPSDQHIVTKKHIEVFLRLLDKYGNLLVTIADAKDSDQILAVLEKTAAPVQSYRLKRASRVFSASINMYPGFAFGREYQLDEKGDFTDNYGQVAAFTTPIGLSLNWGLKRLGTLSAFVSVLDIGAVTAFRLRDTVSVLPDLKWKNVYAPGAYVMWGIPRSPLTLGAGVQYGPALRTVDVVNGIDIKASHLRYGVSLTVDVPLYYVHKRTYCAKKGVKWK